MQQPRFDSCEGRIGGGVHVTSEPLDVVRHLQRVIPREASPQGIGRVTCMWPETEPDREWMRQVNDAHNRTARRRTPGCHHPALSSPNSRNSPMQAVIFPKLAFSLLASRFCSCRPPAQQPVTSLETGEGPDFPLKSQQGECAPSSALRPARCN